MRVSPVSIIFIGDKNMAILIPGTLTIVTKNGRYGSFNIGRLSTSIGEFVVKDKELGLDQYDEGKYYGQFEIAKIRSVHYTYSNGLIVECRAYLASMMLDSNTDLTAEEIETFSTKEQDPLEEEATISPPQNRSRNVNKPRERKNQNANLSTHNVTDNSTSDDASLFGLLWPIGDSVKLDSTCDRQILRLQKKRLSDLGYDFDYKTQLWNLINAS